MVFNNQTQKYASLLAIVILLIIAVGVYLAHEFGDDSPLSVALPAVAVVTFFGVLLIASSTEERVISDHTLRISIASSVVVEYLVLVGVVAFFKSGATDLPKLTDTLLTNFTTIVGVVVAFYFGSSAYVEAKTFKRDKGEGNST